MICKQVDEYKTSSSRGPVQLCIPAPDVERLKVYMFVYHCSCYCSCYWSGKLQFLEICFRLLFDCYCSCSCYFACSCSCYFACACSCYFACYFFYLNLKVNEDNHYTNMFNVYVQRNCS